MVFLFLCCFISNIPQAPAPQLLLLHQFRFVLTISGYLSDRHLGRHLLHLVDVTRHVERALRKGIQLAREDLLEALDGVLQLHEAPATASEDFSHVERLGHESLGWGGVGWERSEWVGEK